MKIKSCFLIGSVWSHGVMQDFYDPSRIDSMQEMFKTTAEHPSVIPLNGTKPIPGTFFDSQDIFKTNNKKSEETLEILAHFRRL